nr:hypothetical protein [Tanacetum cinerariifolium]
LGDGGDEVVRRGDKMKAVRVVTKGRRKWWCRLWLVEVGKTWWCGGDGGVLIGWRSSMVRRGWWSEISRSGGGCRKKMREPWFIASIKFINGLVDQDKNVFQDDAVTSNHIVVNKGLVGSSNDPMSTCSGLDMDNVKVVGDRMSIDKADGKNDDT